MISMNSKNATRVIARLDIKGPNLIKGIQLDGHRVLGTPEYFADLYYREGADELIFQDTVASLYQRNSLLETIKNTASKVFIPITVAGGIRTIEDIRQILRAGADKVAINTAAVQNPSFLREAVQAFGAQCIVASIETYRSSYGKYEVWTDYGRQPTGIDALDWTKQVVDLGVGEILLTSINQEGTGRGFDMELTRKITELAPVPVIAAGGAGKKEHLSEVIHEAKADAVAVASVFHYHYARSVRSINMSFSERRLRMGDNIDSGNIDFINFGYGGYNAIPVTACAIPDMKSFLVSQGIVTRTSRVEA
jgi:cyclase